MRFFSSSLKDNSKSIEYIHGYNNIVKATVHVAFICYIIGTSIGTWEDVSKQYYWLVAGDSVIVSGIVVTYLFFISKKIRSKLAVQILSYLVLSMIAMSYFVVIGHSNLMFYVYRDVILVLILLFVCSLTSGVVHSIIICCISLLMFLTVAFLADNAFLFQRLPNIVLFILGIGGFSIAYNQLQTSLLKRLAESGKQIKELSEYKQNLIRLSIHDLKAPTNSILNICENSKNSDLNQIYSHADVLNKELGNILDIDKLEDSGTRLELSSVAIAKLVEESLRSVEINASRKLINLKTEFEILGTLSCDSRLIYRVLINLLNNAVKYAKTDSEVTVKITGAENSTCAISVHNTGSFIEKKHLPYLFDKFYSVKSKGDSDINSSGLGLAFCELAVNAHGGTIQVNSSVESGTEFTVSLPHFQRESSELFLTHSGQKEVQFSKNEKDMLLPFCEKIKNIPIYKVSPIITTINGLDESGSENIAYWKQLVAEAVYSGDEVLFEKAISVVNE